MCRGEEIQKICVCVGGCERERGDEEEIGRAQERGGKGEMEEERKR